MTLDRELLAYQVVLCVNVLLHCVSAFVHCEPAME